MTSLDSLDLPVSTLKGIGSQTAKRLEKLGIFLIRDLIFHLPFRYEDRTRVYPIASLTTGQTVLICGKVEMVDVVTSGRGSLVCKINDGTGLLTLRFFNFSARQRMALETDTVLSCFGEIRYGYAGLEIVHPEYKIIASLDNCPTEPNLTPVYPLTEGVRQTTLRKAVQQALAIYYQSGESTFDELPESVLQKMAYPNLIEALQTLHSPPCSISLQALESGSLSARKRLAFEELLSHHLSLQEAKKANNHWQAPPFNANQKQIHQFLQSLPFKLTEAQQRVIKEVEQDCQANTPMMRLIQGDVGSGKTVVCAYAALLALGSGYQVAIMAPTELLAEQHYRNFQSWLQSSEFKLVLLTGQIKGKQRQQILQSIADGTSGIIIGTHALFQDAVNFSRLGLIIIDEQHRFGVNQRLALQKKGTSSGIKPHQLIMTATPIPRTLAMLNYSDLDISIIDQLPPGRKPVTTRAISAERRDEVIARIDKWIEQGHQSYWVCTLIEESEILQCEAAEATAEKLIQALPKIRISLVHGRMKAIEKEQMMSDFKNHKIDMLVATTVIEVGVDVPNAGLMIIENPERLGLSQLHQLRGRVGRGDNDSYCLLMYQPPLSESARQRLSILRETTNGFIIADKDLELRGPGEMLGTRQTGQMQFKIADLAKDTELLEQVQFAAKIIEKETPEVIQPLIHRWLGKTTQYAEV